MTDSGGGMHALNCQPSTSTSPPPVPESPISPSSSSTSKNTTTTSSVSPPPSLRSPSLTTTASTRAKLLSGVRGAPSTSSVPATLSARATLLTPSTSLPINCRVVQVHSLTRESFSIAVEQKCQVWDVYHCCCSHLGITETRIMGLAMRSPSEGIGNDKPRHEYFFLQNDQKVSKYLPKQARFSKSTQADKNRPMLVLYLRVRVFIDNLSIVKCDRTLHHYYLQLRENLLDQWSGSNSVSEERCWELATLAVQADETPDQQMTPRQFRAEQYFPLWVINIRGLSYVRKNVTKIVRESRAISPDVAREQFCYEASRSPFGLNCHLYGLRRHKNDLNDNALIGITDKGLDMWDIGEDGERIPLRCLPWNKMAKLTFDHKKITIGGVDNAKISLFAQTDDKARYLLNFCKDVHQQLIQINLHYARKRSPQNGMPIAWGNEMAVDGSRRVPLAQLQTASPSSSATSAQPSPSSGIVPSGARSASPHPLMRAVQKSADSLVEVPAVAATTVAADAAESEGSGERQREGSQTTAPGGKRVGSGCAKALIGSTAASQTGGMKPSGRYEQHQPGVRRERTSPTTTIDAEQAGDIEALFNAASSPPHYPLSEADLPARVASRSSVVATSTSSTTAERRNHLVASHTFDYTSPSPTVLESASRSLHDLHLQGRHPPDYFSALQQKAAVLQPGVARPSAFPVWPASRPLDQQPVGEPVYRGVSEPRLNHVVQMPPPPPARLLTNGLLPATPQQQQQQQQQQAQAQAQADAKKRRRYTSRSPSSRSINRVKSMPEQRLHAATVISSTTQHYAKSPPPYDQAVQLSSASAPPTRKNVLEKRHSTNGIAPEAVRNYPMLQFLIQGMPQSSASGDSSSTPQDGELQSSSLESPTPSPDDFPFLPFGAPAFGNRHSVSSPPSPPFYYASQAPIIWSDGHYSRGEYNFNENVQRALLDANFHANGFYPGVQDLNELPKPPPYPQGSLVM